MTASEATSESAQDLPGLSDIHADAVRLHYLIEALGHLTELGGPQSGPIWAIVSSALPLARDLSNKIEKVMA